MPDLPTPPDSKETPMTTEQNTEPLANSAAYAESAAHLAGMLRGLVSRWETVDFSVSANCFGLDERLQAWHQADDAADSGADSSADSSAAALPAAYWRL